MFIFHTSKLKDVSILSAVVLSEVDLSLQKIDSLDYFGAELRLAW